MSSPWLAVKAASTDVATVISTTANVVVTVASTLEALAAVAQIHATNYRVSTASALSQDLQQNIERRKQSLAISDATFYRDIKKQLTADPELALLYEESLKKYA